MEGPQLLLVSTEKESRTRLDIDVLAGAAGEAGLDESVMVERVR